MNTAVRAKNVPFLPPAWADMLRRSALFATGSASMLACVAAAVALFSYAATDPSLNTASGRAPQNVLGFSGAVFADAGLQTVGVSIGVLVLMVAAWAVRLMRAESVSWLWLRTVTAIAAMLALTLTLEIIPAPAAWPVVAGLGGSAGHVLVDLMVYHNGPFIGLEPVRTTLEIAVAALGAVLGISATLWAMTVKPATTGAVLARGARVCAARVAKAADATLAAWRDYVHSRGAVDIPPPVAAKLEPIIDEEPDDAQEITFDVPPAAMPSETVAVVSERKLLKPSRRELEARQGSLLPAVRKGFDLPHLEILSMPVSERSARTQSREALENNARMLEAVLDDFGIKGQIVKVRPGPVVTLYELEPSPGTKTARVVSLADDIARSMSAVSVRIAVVPGRSVIGIELPNAIRETVFLREMLASTEFETSAGKLVVSLGKDISGAPIFADLARMPHLLVAGTTGSGKSVALNTMILSLLYRNTPEDVRLIMIDPKMLELCMYDGIPHLLAPVVTDAGKAVMALKWVVREMEDRYRAMSQLSVRNISGYNQRLRDATTNSKTLTRTVQTGFDPGTGKPVYEQQALDLTPLPFIVVIIDEMADLMLVAGKDVEAAVQRLAQMARAAGIHVIMATQRPSVDVITGTIKANFPTRVSFQVTSKIDSRTILGEQGAEQLLGQGDMLYMAAGGRITRVHGPLVTDHEVEEVTNHLRDQSQPDYIETVTEEADLDDVPGFSGVTGGDTSSGDNLFDQAVTVVARERKASTSFVQRHLQIGYNRAARIIEEMEQQGMISRANHVGKREVLLPSGGEM